MKRWLRNLVNGFKIAFLKEKASVDKEREFEELGEMLNAYRRRHGLPEKDYRREWSECST